MQEKFQALTKEERLYIVAAVFFFAGFAPTSLSSSEMWLLCSVMDLSEEEIKKFNIPDYDSLISHIKNNSDDDIKHWIITNTYKYVLKSRRSDAEPAFKAFVNDLKWDKNMIKESMALCKELNS